MSSSTGDVSEDGFWVLTEDGWQPTDKQNQALADGAAPHDSIIEIQSSQDQIMPAGYLQDLYPVPLSNPFNSNIKSYFQIGIVAFGSILLLFGMHMDSWTTSPEYDSSEDPDWLENAEAGTGLTEITADCSEVTGIDSDTGEKNKDMCKFAFGLFTGEISSSELLSADTVAELADDLPDEMSGSISEMCNIMVDIESSSEEISSCEDRSSAGSTAIVLFWLSFTIGLISIIIGLVGMFQTIPHSDLIQKIASSVSSIFAVTGFLYWLFMAPVFDDDFRSHFGGAYYVTLLSVLVLITSTILVWINYSSDKERVIIFD